MLEMIHTRRSSEKEDRHDLFSNLLDASEQEENLAPGAVKLQDSELIGLSSSYFFSAFR
jgi:cytochrome P450